MAKLIQTPQSAIKLLKQFFKIWKLISNSYILLLAKDKWAEQVQNIANDFSCLQHNIDKKYEYGKSQEVLNIAKRIEEINKKTHSLWGDMKKKLKII